MTAFWLGISTATLGQPDYRRGVTEEPEFRNRAEDVLRRPCTPDDYLHIGLHQANTVPFPTALRALNLQASNLSSTPPFPGTEATPGPWLRAICSACSLHRPPAHGVSAAKRKACSSAKRHVGYSHVFGLLARFA
jgi:hypothetical protein